MKARTFLDRHGRAAVFFGRLLPTVKTVYFGAGRDLGHAVSPFLLCTALGTTVWTTLLAVAGYLLQGQYEAVSDYVNPVSNVVFGLAAMWYVYRVVTFKREEPAQ